MSWISELSVLLAAEFHHRRTIGTLCTVDQNGEPRARMVIVRSLDEASGEIWMATDSRSAKVAQLTAHPAAELVFWSGSERQQFRIHGKARIVHDAHLREENWKQMSDATRATYYWPTPGAPFEEGQAFADAIPAGLSVPENYVMVVVEPSEVESLEINERPHCRRRWRETNGWAEEHVNP
jgi:PPOX class probable FMN-dependent enzyme